MGILTRPQGELFVISSDETQPGPANKRPPRRVNGPYRVWTGDSWSAEIAAALTFESLDEADDYVKLHYAQLSS